jgi:hypothetical protein
MKTLIVDLQYTNASFSNDRVARPKLAIPTYVMDDAVAAVSHAIGL